MVFRLRLVSELDRGWRLVPAASFHVSFESPVSGAAKVFRLDVTCCADGIRSGALPFSRHRPLLLVEVDAHDDQPDRRGTIVRGLPPEAAIVSSVGVVDKPPSAGEARFHGGMSRFRPRGDAAAGGRILLDLRRRCRRRSNSSRSEATRISLACVARESRLRAVRAIASRRSASTNSRGACGVGNFGHRPQTSRKAVYANRLAQVEGLEPAEGDALPEEPFDLSVVGLRACPAAGRSRHAGQSARCAHRIFRERAASFRGARLRRGGLADEASRSRQGCAHSPLPRLSSITSANMSSIVRAPETSPPAFE